MYDYRLVIVKIFRQLLGLFILFLFSCHKNSSHLIKIDGSSTVYPLSEAVAEEYLIHSNFKDKLQITVGISGTGGGFKKFCRGDIDIAGASRPIKDKEMAACKGKNIEYIELMVAYDAAVIVVHKKNMLAEISTEQLKKIWSPESQDKIKKWSDVEKSWSSLDLKLYGAGSDSGTFDYFTEAIMHKSKSSRSDYTASEDDNTIVNGVSAEEGALGYLPFAYYEENIEKLKALAVNNKAGKYVLPTVKSIETGEYNPLSRPLFIYVNKKSFSKNGLKDFVSFYIQNAKKLSLDIKMVPLPTDLYTKAEESVKLFNSIN